MKRLFSLVAATFLAFLLAWVMVSTAAAQYYSGLAVEIDAGDGVYGDHNTNNIIDNDWGSGLTLSKTATSERGQPVTVAYTPTVTLTGLPQHYRINHMRVKFVVDVVADVQASIPALSYTITYIEQGGATRHSTIDLGRQGSSYTFDQILTLQNTSPLESFALKVAGSGRSERKTGSTASAGIRITFNEIHAYDCETAPVGIPNRWNIPNKGDGDGNVAWLALDRPWNNWWHSIEISSTGRMLVVAENTEQSVPTPIRPEAARDFDLEVWSADCSQLLASSKEVVMPTVTTPPIPWRGDRILVDVQAGKPLRTHVFGKTADDYEQGPDQAALFEAIRIGNINKALAPLGGTQCYRAPAGEPGGTCSYTGTFTNRTADYDIVDLTFVVTRLSGGNTLLHSDSHSSQNIVKHSESNWVLPHTTGGIPVLGPGEQHTVTLEVALTTTVGFDLYVDVYGILFEKGQPVGPASAAANSPESFEGPSFALVTMEGQPVAWLDDAAAPQLFLPAVAR